MADSWEDEAVNQPPKLNPTAASFNFNPGASTFTLTGASNSPEEPLKPVVAPPSKPESTPSLNHSKPAAPESKMNGTQESPKDAAPESREDSVEATTKQAKKLAVADEEETDAQKSSRETGIKKALEELNAEDPREHMNVVFIGHVDAGKSTTAGQILFITGGVDDRTIEKYEREAKEKNRESWYMAYIMDTNEEERTKGITVEVGRAYFETPKKRYTILDAPGHKSYVPNMISGASQADVGVLVISARKGEFETGFEKGGQTREHAQLAKTLGVSKLVVVINKMDDPTVAGPNGEWQKERFDEIEAKLMPFLKGCGYNPKKDLVVLPISGLFGHNMKERVDNKFCDWYSGPSLFEVLDEVEPTNRDPLGAFRMPIMDRYKDMGTIVMGKSESGLVKKGDSLVVMPNKVPVKVISVYRDESEVNAARPGENLRLRLQGIEEEDISSGFVVSSRYNPVPVVTVFEAQIAVLELLEHKPILTGGYKAILHIHSVVEECEVTKIVAVIDPKTKEKKKAKFVKSGAVLIARIAVEKAICIEPFDKVPQLGRFTLRDEGKTVAIGKVIKLPKSKE